MRAILRRRRQLASLQAETWLLATSHYTVIEPKREDDLGQIDSPRRPSNDRDLQAKNSSANGNTGSRIPKGFSQNLHSTAPVPLNWASLAVGSTPNLGFSWPLDAARWIGFRGFGVGSILPVSRRCSGKTRLAYTIVQSPRTHCPSGAQQISRPLIETQIQHRGTGTLICSISMI